MGNHDVECEFCGSDLRGPSGGHAPGCSRSGTGYIDVTIDLFGSVEIRSLLPGSYRIVGSERSYHPGTIRLRVESEELVGHSNRLTMTVHDEGSTRRVVIEKVETGE